MRRRARDILPCHDQPVQPLIRLVPLSCGFKAHSTADFAAQTPALPAVCPQQLQHHRRMIDLCAEQHSQERCALTCALHAIAASVEFCGPMRSPPTLITSTVQATYLPTEAPLRSTTYLRRINMNTRNPISKSRNRLNVCIRWGVDRWSWVRPRRVVNNMIEDISHHNRDLPKFEIDAKYPLHAAAWAVSLCEIRRRSTQRSDVQRY